MVSKTGGVLWILSFSCFILIKFADSKVPQEEVDVFQKIITTMGATNWNFNADDCSIEMGGVTPQAPSRSVSEVKCDCNSSNNTVCHITNIVLKGYNLPGSLPSELVNLPNIYEVDFAYNFLYGTIPSEWSLTQLSSISLLANRLSGEIPKELGNITTLTYLNLEANNFSGSVPSELGKLTNLQTLIISSNQLTGKLPASFSGLINLSDFRMNGNNFNGSVPDFIQDWKQLSRLEMQATGLEGPIPANLSRLNRLTILRITDMEGPTQGFPVLSNITGIDTLVLRNCNISGEIPLYVWRMRELGMLDVSFNELRGIIPDELSGRSSLRFLFVTGNKLSGNVPLSFLQEGMNVDLSYNNFTWQDPEQPTCRQNMNLYINLFKSSSTMDILKDTLPCSRDITCPKYRCSFHVNCGGDDVTVSKGNRRIVYEGDGEVEGGSAKYFRSGNYWGFSSTGDFMDDDNFQNTRFIKTLSSTNLPEIYRTARISPLSLTYFYYCLEKGSYRVNLHFAEIVFTNDNTYNSLGRRLFDIYIQDKLVWKDFNIEDEARVAQRPVIVPFNATVTDNTLEIRLYWAGKGTMKIPNRGVYGPLISAISVYPNSKSCPDGDNKNLTVFLAVGVLIVCIIVLILGVLWWKGCLRGRKRKTKEKDFEGLDLQMVSFTLKQLKAATNNFDMINKIGEGGFGPVYKGLLPDKTIIAVKQLSSKSRQGNREFLNEIGLISCLQHPNLVKLNGCCIEGDQLMLVYEYMENNSLANALFGSEDIQLILDWPTRFKIALGIAKGLAFLHVESRLKIVHRDIKATNVLLDGDLNPKISDFGLAKLNEDERTHISTRIAGTIGYMAPEYALWGHLTYKADVYSYGVLALEIVSGKNNNNYMPSNNCICLLDWACHLQQSRNFDGILDERLKVGVNKEEVEVLVKVGLMCTNASPSPRPTMPEVVSMLEGKMTIPDEIPQPSSYVDDLRFKSMREFHQAKQSQIHSGSQTQNSSTIETDKGSSSVSNT